MYSSVAEFEECLPDYLDVLPFKKPPKKKRPVI